MIETQAGFDQFWQVYPRRVGKFAAEKAFVKAQKLASVADILDGVERYKRTKPAYADWCHPATWLNQGRWLDDIKVSQVLAPQWDWQCPHNPACHDRAWCQRFGDARQQLRLDRGEA